MSEKEKEIFVYDSFQFSEPVLMGVLYIDSQRGNESCSFEYAHSWLRQAFLDILIDPELFYYEGRQFPSGKKMFGVFADASPDRWGRVLMNKRERIAADRENRKPKKLHNSDYLLGVYDETRMGGIRFKADPEGAFLSNDSDSAVPSWASLRTLEEAGQLWIAKFPSQNDENDTGAWEKVVHDLAYMCGLRVPEAKMERFSRLGSTFLVKRFDREGNRRIHFASAMTLLNKTDGASAEDGISYLDLADFIRASGAEPEADLAELWRRIVFNMAVTNSDDHLRNHAFLFTSTGWRLSPLYDVNPVPYGDELSLNVDESDNRISLDLAYSVAERFGFSLKDAKKEAESILQTVRGSWRRIAVQCRLTHGQMEEMAPAFRLCDLC